jgi:hypothetical protein
MYVCDSLFRSESVLRVILGEGDWLKKNWHENPGIDQNFFLEI